MSEPKVWIAETGEYEQRMIWGVYASPEDAVALIKAQYGAPYQVAWRAPEIDEDGDWTLIGDFEAVPHYSTRHVARYNIHKWDVQRA